MAGDSPVLKRQRGDVEVVRETLTLEVEGNEEEDQQETNKRQKTSSSSSPLSYSHILSFLEEDEEKLTHQDLSSLITALQKELSPSGSPVQYPLYSSSGATSDVEAEVASAAFDEEVDDKERVFRHLLEASDDELGLPSRDDGTSSSCSSGSHSPLFTANGGDEVDGLMTTLGSFDHELWEFEDEAANYYALLQSELFMEGDEPAI
ncbi:hypothetical protein SAY86_014386 [Trapa natans]|uniref:Uncharacterized protein n=1 Tax=Trapa natans TaxID=22666 RepID=A0AAN7L0J1_TRANT|nr:hypothetical protein SAY86_014386 [Trapa natans]